MNCVAFVALYFTSWQKAHSTGRTQKIHFSSKMVLIANRNDGC